jgi:dihydroorotase
VILIHGGQVVDPGHVVGLADVVIENGLIVAVGQNLDRGQRNGNVARIDATRLLVLPGFVDLHVHLREPGFEYKETIATGTRAAVAGGFTTVCCMPNTKPVNDDVAVTHFVRGRAREANRATVYPIGAITKGSAGRELTDYLALKEAGCVAVSDDGHPVMDAEVMYRAMQQAAEVDLPVIEHCEDLSLSGCGCVNDGPVSRALRLHGMPSKAEERMVWRDIRLAEETGARLHVAHVSTAGAVEAVRKAKERGLPVTAEVCPHHFSLTEEAVRDQQAHAKMNPPLRTEQDREALIAGLTDGTIDAVATDHAPHAEYEKERGNGPCALRYCRIGDGLRPHMAAGPAGSLVTGTGDRMSHSPSGQDRGFVQGHLAARSRCRCDVGRSAGDLDGGPRGICFEGPQYAVCRLEAYRTGGADACRRTHRVSTPSIEGLEEM